MSWQECAGEKLISAEAAAALVRDGMRVGFGITAGHPTTLEAALVARAPELAEVEIGPMFPQLPTPMTREGLEPHFHRWCIYALPPIRAQVQSRRVGIAPPALGLFRSLEGCGRTNPHAWDVFMVRASPPDEHGDMSLGNGVWYSQRSVHLSTTVIVEVDEAYPRPCGDNLINLRDVDFVVAHEPTPAYVRPTATGERSEIADVIGALAATLINDGDTIQIGGGVASGATYRHLGDKHNLGYHAEVGEEILLDLVESGVINGSKKEINPNQAVAALFFGSERVARTLDRNPAFGVYGSDYTNNPRVISQFENFISIQNGIAADLTGQITSESIDGQIYGGPGGQLDFVIGASLSPGGRSVLCLPSTTSDGRSRIVPVHPEGTVVTIPRHLIDFVVTEHGIASLGGKTERQRADELIAIAHPDHRAELAAVANRRFSCPL